MTETDERLDLAVAAALEASAIPRQLFRSDAMDITWKADDSPVTRADKEAETMLRRHIEAHCPDDAIVGEEFPTREGSSGFRWYLDPIDGTQSFIRGVPLFGTMVALEQDGEPLIGVIVFPALGEIIYAAKSGGCWWASGAGDATCLADLNSQAAVVSATASLADAALSSSALELYAVHGLHKNFERLLARAKVSRGWSDCYGHYLVATGRVDAMVEPVMNIWDNAPLLPIITEAGGRFTDLAGNAVIDSGNALSSNGLLHDALLKEWHG
jgi:histidinol phosphatase-like enzyme (inositol monophosphatase family)